ncbi:MAG: gliding motility lipoprotein GldH [Syntrophothermus sp.]
MKNARQLHGNSKNIQKGTSLFRMLIYSAFLFLVPGFYGCDKNHFYDENAVIENGTWNSRDKKTFTVTITDTLSRYNFFLNVRNDADYGYSNLYLFVHTRLPNGISAVDTVECMLADPDGKWRGSGIGSLKYNRFALKKGVVLRPAGKYIFELEQAMRVENLKGIRDVGIRIEKESR